MQTPEFDFRRLHADNPALTVNGAAYSVGLYSQDIGGRDGVPIRADRTRHPLANS